MDEPPIETDELLIMRVPREKPFFDKRVTSANFDPKPGEKGISVSRRRLTSPAKLLSLAPETMSFFVVEITQDTIDDLGLKVVPKATEEDPGHAEITPIDKLRSRKLRRALAMACKEIDKDDYGKTQDMGD